MPTPFCAWRWKQLHLFNNTRSNLRRFSELATWWNLLNIYIYTDFLSSKCSARGQGSVNYNSWLVSYLVTENRLKGKWWHWGGWPISQHDQPDTWCQKSTDACNHGIWSVCMNGAAWCIAGSAIWDKPVPSVSLCKYLWCIFRWLL